MNVAVRPSLNILSICTGGAGLDLGIELALPGARSVCMVEREAFAVAHLVAAMQQGLMAPAPVWGDVRTFDGKPWRGLVDGLIGGIPCQPWSLAGRRGGTEDERDLWSDARRIIVQSRPWFVLIENVRGMLSAKPGFDPGALRVRRDLQRLGFRVEGGLFTAAEVGASHERERLFILGVAEWAAVGLADCDDQHDDGAGIGRQGRRGQPSDGGSGVGQAHACGGDAERRGGAGDLEGQGVETEGQARERQRGGDAVGYSCEAVPGVGQADAYITRSQGHGDAGERPGERAAWQGSGELGDTSIARGGGVSVQPRRQDEASAHADGPSGFDGAVTVDQVDCARVGRGKGRAEPAVRGGRDSAGVAGGPMVDAVGGGHGGQSPDLVRRPVERDADEWASDRSLFPPGPQDSDEWGAIAEHAPQCLPAVSRHDRFSIAIRAALTAAHGDPEKRNWLDPKGPFGLRAAVVQEIAESDLRRMADGVAESRVDWLRLLGNGVVPLEAAYAFRTLTARLAERGSAGATQLIGMMD